MNGEFLLLCLSIAAPALGLMLWPLWSRHAGDDPQARGLRDALHRAHTAGALSDQELKTKLAALPAQAEAQAPLRALALLLAVSLPALAWFGWTKIGAPDALDPTRLLAPTPAATSAPEFEQAVADLAERMRQNPEAEGLRLLARSYQRLQRFDDSRAALATLRDLAPDDLDVQVEYAEALALASPTRQFDTKSRALLQDALSRNPEHQRALWLAGIEALQRQDQSAALGHWQKLEGLLPPQSEVLAAVREQIRKLGGEPAATAETNTPSATPAETNSSAAAVEAGRSIRIDLRIAPALLDRVAAEDTVFVFARAAEGPRMPLAIQRLRAADLPRQIVLDDSQAMLPGNTLSQHPRLILGARISKSGHASAQPGDLEVLSDPLGPDQLKEPVALEISRIVE